MFFDTSNWESCGSALTHITPILPKQCTHIAGPTPLDNRFRNFRDEMSFSLGSQWGDYRFQPVTRLFSSVCSLCGDTWKTWFLKTKEKRGESDTSLEWLAPVFPRFPTLAEERLVAACNAQYARQPSTLGRTAMSTRHAWNDILVGARRLAGGSPVRSLNRQRTRCQCCTNKRECLLRTVPQRSNEMAKKEIKKRTRQNKSKARKEKDESLLVNFK